ncbi:MAG: NYN domain-containing protein [Clostridiales bacterium]|nr:NYN domain-containing protein [Clostridiales bacterium]
MLRDKNIAFFIDVDNVGLNNEQYADIIDQLSVMGSVMSGKIYGAGERKHKEIYENARACGYTLASTMRVKRRGRKDFDARIYVDVVDTISHAAGIDAVCIIAQPTDLVHLYSYIHGRGLKIIALDNGDEASNALIDEVVQIKDASDVKPVKKPVAAKPAPAKRAQPVADKPVEQPAPAKNDDLDRTDELLREIERLRNLASAPVVEEPAKAEEPAQEEPVQEEVAAPEASEEAPEQAEPTSTPRASYTPSNERDLMRRIEEIRKNSQGDNDEFVDEIRKLLDGLE